MNAAIAVVVIAPSILPLSFRWPCFYFSVFHVYCPGCGAQRAVASLMHGDVATAIHNNALLFTLPLWLLAFAIARKSSNPRTEKLVIAGAFLVMLGFTLARNLPGSGLAPIT